MPNANYLKGRRAEYHWMKCLREMGWVHVGRTAGSHGPFDVWAVRQGAVYLYQIKQGGKPTGADRLKFIAFRNLLDGVIVRGFLVHNGAVVL